MKSQQRKGMIINITPDSFFTGSHGFAHYVSSKGCIIGLTGAGTLEDVVGAVAFLASNESDFITGQTIVVNGGTLIH